MGNSTKWSFGLCSSLVMPVGMQASHIVNTFYAKQFLAKLFSLIGMDLPEGVFM